MHFQEEANMANPKLSDVDVERQSPLAFNFQYLGVSFI